MSSSKMNTYSKPLQHLVPKGFNLQDDATEFMSYIIYEINNDFIDAVYKTAQQGKEIRANTIEESIKPLIPRELWRYVSGAGKNAVLRFNSGLVTYEVPSMCKAGHLEPRMLKKGIEELAGIVHTNLKLSKGFCSLITNEMQRLALYIAEQSIASITTDLEVSLTNLKRILRDILGPDMASHAEGHAHDCLQLYRNGHLYFSLKPFRRKVARDEGCKTLPLSIQKLARSHIKVSLVPEALFKVERGLKEVIAKILENTEAQESIDDVSEITEGSIHESAKEIVPEILFIHMSAHAQANVMHYRTGSLKYKHIIKAKKGFKGGSKDEESEPELIITDYGKSIKRTMAEYNSTVSKEVVILINEMLNDLSHALAEKCYESAKKSINAVTGNDIIDSVNNLLPPDMRNHAYARIRYLQEHVIRPNGQTNENDESVLISEVNVQDMEVE